MFTISISTFFFFVTFLRLSESIVSDNSSHTAFLFTTTNAHGPLSGFRSGNKRQEGQQMSASSRDGFARTSLWSPSDSSWRKRWSLPLAFPVSDGCNSNEHSFYFGTERRFLVGSSSEDSWKEWPENLSNRSRTRTVCSFEETRDCRSLSEELVREGLLLLAKSENVLLLQTGQCLEKQKWFTATNYWSFLRNDTIHSVQSFMFVSKPSAWGSITCLSEIFNYSIYPMKHVKSERLLLNKRQLSQGREIQRYRVETSQCPFAFEFIALKSFGVSKRFKPERALLYREQPLTE